MVTVRLRQRYNYHSRLLIMHTNITIPGDFNCPAKTLYTSNCIRLEIDAVHNGIRQPSIRFVLILTCTHLLQRRDVTESVC